MDEQKKKKIYVAVIVISTVIIGAVASLFIIKLIRKVSFNDALSNVTKAVKTGFPGANRIETSGHTVYITVWVEGMFDASKLAATGNEKAFKSWNELRDNMYLTVFDICDRFTLVDDAKVYFYLVSEKNTDNELLVFENRSIIYDGVYEYISRNGG